MSKLTHKIDANDRTVSEVLNGKKYTVGYFQREYNWESKHIEQLVTDLTSAFLNEYTPGDSRQKGEEYNNYYLNYDKGPFVISKCRKMEPVVLSGRPTTSDFPHSC